MSRKVVLVVGDKFAKFAVGKDVMTLSQLYKLIEGVNTIIPGHTRIIFVPGQGLGDEDVDAILSRSVKSPHRNHLDFSQWRNLPKRASASKSHKVSPENILISEPYRVAEDIFEMHLLIDDKSELMQDHQTGQHLQGMLLIEAARQSQIAITEAFFMPVDGKYSFVFNDMSVKYNYFAFPFPAILHCVVQERDTSKAKRQSISCDISIIQNSTETVSMTIRSQIAETQKITNRESRLAARATESYIKEVTERLYLEESNDIVINA